MIQFKMEGLENSAGALQKIAKQVQFATAKSLTKTAYDSRTDVKQKLVAEIVGGATPYTQRAFNVEPAKRENLQSSVYLRHDGPAGGTEYSQAIAHLFQGGRRNWKRLEGWLRGKNIIPLGYMIAPGSKIPLDGRGNIRAAALKEMLTILGSETRNLESWRRSGKGKQRKAIGFFVARPGDKSGLPPGVWRRITTGKSGTVEPWIMFIKPVAYRQKFDLQKIVQATVDRSFRANFDKSLADALRTAR